MISKPVLKQPCVRNDLSERISISERIAVGIIHFIGGFPRKHSVPPFQHVDSTTGLIMPMWGIIPVSNHFSLLKQVNICFVFSLG